MTTAYSSDRKRWLSRAALIVAVIGLTAFAIPFMGSLKPSARSEAVYAQGRFAVSELEDMQPGEVRLIETGIGYFFAVGASVEINDDLQKNTDQMREPAAFTYDDEFDAYLVWGIAPTKRGTRCGVGYVPKDFGYWPSLNAGLFSDPCTGFLFDLSGRIMKGAFALGTESLRKPEFVRVDGDQYQITNADYLLGIVGSERD